MTTAQINRRIKWLDIQIIKGQGYSYFIELPSPHSPQDEPGEQIGESVMVHALSHLTLDQWAERAAFAWVEHHARRLPFSPETVKEVLHLAKSGPEAIRYLDAAATMGRDPVELWEKAQLFKGVPLCEINAPSGVTATRQPRIRTAEEYAAHMAELRRTVKRSERSPQSFFPRLRRAYAAHHAYETGTINRQSLIDAFDISKAQASADLQQLLREFPGLLRYDLSAKTYHWHGGHALPKLPAPIASLTIHPREQ